jgi:hypothetical protein
MMDFGKAFTFLFEDKEWLQKILLVGLVTLIPFIGWLFVLGWTLEISRRVSSDAQQTLPGLEEFSERLVQGLKGFVIAFVYSLPITFIALAFAAILAVETEAIAEAIIIATVVYVCCISAYSVILVIFMPPAFGALADTGQISEAFRFGRLWSLMKAAPGAYILAIIGVWLAGLISMVGLLLCCIGVIFTAAYAAAVQGHLYGQAYREGSGGVGNL